MKASTQILKLNKRHALTISRGCISYSNNIFLLLSDLNHTGLGECDPGFFGDHNNYEHIKNSALLLEKFINNNNLSTRSIYEIWRQADEEKLPKTLLAALDMALWDLLAKKSSLPLYQLFGLSNTMPPTSITLGITPLEEINRRVQELLEPNKFRALKIKLGSKKGIAHDQESFLVIKNAAKNYNIKLRVDANGGWSLQDAKIMCAWLAEHGVEYIEQPMSPELDNYLPELFKTRTLPIFVDESCHISSDIVKLSHCIDGINIKLMKCGGLSEALRMVAVARAHKLKTMIGCMSESSLSLSAAASIGSLFDYIDLDSAFNLDPDPAHGLTLVNGSLALSKIPGHGASLC